MGLPISPHPRQHLLSFLNTNLVRVKWYCFSLRFPSGCWSWISSHVLTCHLYIFFEELSIEITARYWIGLIFLLSCKFSSYILNTRPLSGILFAQFSPILYAVSSLSWWHHLQKRVFNWPSPICVPLPFITCTFGVASKKSSPNSGSYIWIPKFPSKSFLALALKFRSMTQCELSLCTMWGQSSDSFFCMRISSCLSTICCKDFSPIKLRWHPCWK